MELLLRWLEVSSSSKWGGSGGDGGSGVKGLTSFQQHMHWQATNVDPGLINHGLLIRGVVLQ